MTMRYGRLSDRGKATIHALTCAALLAAGPFGGLQAQEETQPVVTEGSKVRVTTLTELGRIVGTLASVGEDHIVLDVSSPKNLGGSTQLAWDEVDQLEVSLGYKRQYLKGGAIGFGVGAVLGTALYASVSADQEKTFESFGALILVPVAVGTGVGLLIGGVSKKDQWERIDLATLEPVVSLLPQRNHSPAIRIGLRLRL